MHVCIVSEASNVRDRIRLALEGPLLESVRTSELDLDELIEQPGSLEPDVDVVFFAVTRLDDSQLETIRLLNGMAADTKIVVVSPTTESSAVIKSVRAGASDFLSLDPSFEDEFISLLRRLQSESSRSRNMGKTFTVLPCQNKSDANQLAVNLAVIFAQRSSACGLLDFHFRGGELALLLKQEPRHTVLDLLKQTNQIDEAMLQQAVSIHESGVHLLAAPPAFSDLWHIQLQSCQEIVALAKQRWPLLLINCEDAQHSEQIRSAALSDEIVLAMRLDVASLLHTRNHLEYFASKDVSSERIHIVAMGSGQSGEIPLKGAKKLLGVRHIHTIPDDPSVMLRSLNLGNPLVLESPHSKASLAIESLAARLLHQDQQTRTEKGNQFVSAFKAAAVLTCNAIPAMK